MDILLPFIVILTTTIIFEIKTIGMTFTYSSNPDKHIWSMDLCWKKP